MSRNGSARVLAIGIDASEPKLIRRMIDQDELPVLKSLLSEGKWIRVHSPTSVGTSSVWPTFLTGQDPDQHGIYSEWCWEPATMSLGRAKGYRLKPFWKQVAETGKQIGILGVPFMPLIGLSNGFEIAESYPYLSPESETQFASARLPEDISARAAREALSHGRINVSGPEDHKNIQKLASDSLKGIKLRGELAERLLIETQPDLSIIVFTEAHESGHCLWQTVAPEHSIYSGSSLKKLRDISPSLENIYQEVDRQTGKLIENVGPDATVLVFSLHGMRPTFGAPGFLAPLMCEAGFSRLSNLRNQSWRGRAKSLISVVKRHTPWSLKRIYYKTFPRSAVVRWATPTMLAPYDWSQTRAFSLVVEQHGSIRVNLIGREAKGIVPIDEYEQVCQQLEQWLRTLSTEDGKPLVKKIIRLAESAEQALTTRLPDLLVYWDAAAFASSLRVKGSQVEFSLDARRYLSEHTSAGFCIVKSNRDFEVENVVQAKDLGRLITDIVRNSDKKLGQPPQRPCPRPDPSPSSFASTNSAAVTNARPAAKSPANSQSSQD